MVKKPVMPLVLLACSMMLASCDTTPPAFSTLMNQVTQACQARNKDALRACYASEAVSRDQIDRQVEGWDAYLDKGEGWSYSGITYVSLADAPKNKSILPETIAMTQPTTMSGFKFAPNIKVIGFVLVSFKQPNGDQAGETLMVGFASDGTAKIAVIEPHKT